jgi:hypothetical protein
MAGSDGVPEEETPAMSIAMTCDCGARYEVEDLFAGQEVHCPECQHPARAPLVKDAPRRVSLLALYSLVVAVVGGFTLVGSAAAALLALISLARMRTGSGRRGGEGYAVAALVVAAAGAAATVGILNSPAASRLVGWQRRGGLASRVDTSGPPQVGSRDNACVLIRPPGWGRLLEDRGLDPSIGFLQTNRDVILTGPTGEAYIDIRREPGIPGDLSEYGDRLALELQTPPPTDDEDDNPMNRPPQDKFFRVDKGLPDIDGYEGHEWIAHLPRGKQTWTWMLRVYRKRAGGEDKARPVYILRGYVPAKRFQAVEPEMRKALDSVRFPP